MPFCVNHPSRDADFHDLKLNVWYCAECVGPVLKLRDEQRSGRVWKVRWSGLLLFGFGVPALFWLFGAENLAVAWIEAFGAVWLIILVIFAMLWVKFRHTTSPPNTSREGKA
jgi:hypothetical protein